jgi:hypothetical protein
LRTHRSHLINPTYHTTKSLAKMLLSPEELAQSSIPLPEVIEARQFRPTHVTI